jgi:hypothetical protein
MLYWFGIIIAIGNPLSIVEGHAHGHIGYRCRRRYFQLRQQCPIFLERSAKIQ